MRSGERGSLAAPALGLIVSVLLIGAAASWVDLRPAVGRDFFFASSSRTLRDASRIEELFDLHSQLVVIATSGAIGSQTYADRVEALGGDLIRIDGVSSLRSIARGPDGLEDARESPLWRRLLLSRDGSATHLLLWVGDPWPESLVPAVEAVLERHRRADFELRLAGIPYTVAVMQRQLAHDFRVFGSAAVVVFGVVSLVLFRSVRVTLGILASCAAAVAASFLALQALEASLGLLSANLVAIVFVLTQSHLVFLTSNWRRLAHDCESGDSARAAVSATLRPSLGSMVTTLLGFGTLLLVDAKPLRELGLGGVVGSLSALVVAYGIYPLFLLGANPVRPSTGRAARVDGLASRRLAAWGVGLAGACSLAGTGLARLDTDPSLLAYFDQEGEVHGALDHLDRNTGSAPLHLVVRRPERRSLLASDEAYRKLGEVQRELERDPAVGTVVSLPVVLAEGNRHPLSFLIPRSWMLRLLESPLFERVGTSFITSDRTHALFALQMVERERDAPRVEVVERLRQAVAQLGLEVPWVGGVYYLQGRLSQLVARSTIESLAALGVLFALVAWVTTGSLRVALAMIVALAFVPVAVFGGMGWLGVPVDVVAAPAVSVGLGLAADAVLHLGVAARRVPGLIAWNGWVSARRSQWKGIARVSLIVASGFALFALSGFPPTRRFGLAVSAAAAIAAPLALVLLPLLACPRAPRSAS